MISKFISKSKQELRVFLRLSRFYSVLILQKAAIAYVERLKIALLHLDP